MILVDYFSIILSGQDPYAKYTFGHTSSGSYSLKRF